MSDWLTYNPSSGRRNGTITLTAATLSELNDRVTTLVAYNNTYSLTASTIISQEIDKKSQYLTFNITSGGVIDWSCTHNYYGSRDISYSKDNGSTWTTISSYGSSAQINVLTGDKVMFKGDNSAYAESNSYNRSSFSGTTAKFTLEGNIMSLVNSSGFSSATTLNANNTFYGLFSGCTGLTSAKKLVMPANAIRSHSYESMFEGCTALVSAPDSIGTSEGFNHPTGYNLIASACCKMFKDCTSLVNPPELPATHFASGYSTEIYREMFRGCTSLTTAPVLPATTLANGCYVGMFAECTSLVNPPELLVTDLSANNDAYALCYVNMFYGCTSLTRLPTLPAYALSTGCYANMFHDCTSLTTIPSNYLPVTALTSECYRGMFAGCTGLTSTPSLPSTSLAVGCYRHMFAGCTSLTTAPALPATTLQEDCYHEMFRGCTSLTTAPELPAPTLTSKCYLFMFYGCTSLNYVKCLATDISASSATTSWLSNVASTGTFVKTSSMTDWTTGENGIPSGWTVQNYSFGIVDFVFASTDDYGEFNIVITGTSFDYGVTVDGISETGTLTSGLTSGQTFSIGVQNLNSFGLGTRHIGISYAYTPNYTFYEVPSGEYVWVSGLQFEPNKKVYVQVY